MDITVSVDLGNTASLIERLKKLEATKRGIAAAGLYLKGKMSVYPPVNRPKNPYLTPRQRRYLAIAASKGEIDIPYKRGISPGSETMGRKWANEARDGGFTQVVGNNASYVEAVMGEPQLPYMRLIGWKKYTDIAREEEAAVLRIVESEASRDFV